MWIVRLFSNSSLYPLSKRASKHITGNKDFCHHFNYYAYNKILINQLLTKKFNDHVIRIQQIKKVSEFNLDEKTRSQSPIEVDS